LSAQPQGSALADASDVLIVEVVPNSILTPVAPVVEAVRDRVELMGAAIDRCTVEQTIGAVRDGVATGRGGWLLTANLDQIRRFAHGDAAVQRYFGEADLVVADGMPLVWASRIAGVPLPERVAGSDLIHSLTAAMAADGRRVFLLGGNPGTADSAAATFREQHPELEIAGTYCPPFGFEHDEDELEAMRSALTATCPDVVYVALGFPKQEHLIARLRGDFPTTWFVGVGISFSFVSGEVRRAPRWVQASGLEWVHRLVQEPRRLARRYLVDGLPFAARLLAHSCGVRLRRRRRHMSI
jgi:N-acetylglucosaminyldiphosphoundecaprenol N-acetyl-beta-D-mannosaminyltransferase